MLGVGVENDFSEEFRMEAVAVSAGVGGSQESIVDAIHRLVHTRTSRLCGMYSFKSISRSYCAIV
ncbi:hypothetical protein [Paenibacillus sp. J22TS3]|uniref:hypothetical protein n=1 Tax=Paenibacillus sp. J22TS3 TaxID=2807192 RepID=UPI001B25CC5C|nr:hypothetical protein [Paenibacillus sp. J22TS3]GIP21163.1 hypothetical protein J22TS3_14380 [Paenibacillus sp. J22TS3]